MRKYLEAKMPEELKALHKVSKHKKIADKGLFDILRTNVRNFKQAGMPQRNKRDRLAKKLADFGNEGAYAGHLMDQLIQHLYDRKGVEMESVGKWISVEIECIFRNPNAEKEFCKFARKQGYGKYVTVKDDGSIHPSARECECEMQEGEDPEQHRCQYYGREIVVSFKFGEWEMLYAICSKLIALDCYVNKTCGLHVHFDCRHLTQRQVTFIGNRVARAIPALKQILPRSRQQNRFCNTNINRHNSNPNGDSRYAFVNLLAYGRHKTLEIRGHSGTISAHKIVCWIRILRKILDKSYRKEVVSVEDMVRVYGFESDLVNYTLARFEKFNKKQIPVGDDVLEDDRVEEMANIAEILGQPAPAAPARPVVERPMPARRPRRPREPATVAFEYNVNIMPVAEAAMPMRVITGEAAAGMSDNLRAAIESLQTQLAQSINVPPVVVGDEADPWSTSHFEEAEEFDDEIPETDEDGEDEVA